MVVKAHVKDPGSVKYRGLAVSHVTAVIIYEANALCKRVSEGWTGLETIHIHHKKYEIVPQDDMKQ